MACRPPGVRTEDEIVLSRRNQKHRRSHARISLGVAAVLTAAAACGIVALAQANQSSGPQPYALQSEFTAAAQEFHVPASVLLAGAYQESRWDTHNGQPSTTGNY